MRLIDADAVIEKWETYEFEEFEFEIMTIGAINELKKQPTIDAVPVVRCKDCKFNRNAKTFVNEQNCIVFERSMKEDGYCSFGSKRGKYDHS